jgi:hypothetical protein
VSTTTSAPDLKGVIAFDLRPGAVGVDDLDSYRPEDPATFGVSLELYVGMPDAPAGDAFDILVCSPRWLVGHFDHPALQQRLPGGHVVPGRGLWLMERWDLGQVKASIDLVLGSVTGERWADIADWLSRHLPWEYEYRYDEARGLSVDYSGWEDRRPDT